MSLRSRVLAPLLRLSVNHWVWLGGTVLLIGGLGTNAVTSLLKVPELPDCWTVYLGDRSPSAQLYCAEMVASKRTIEDLQKAIDLVDSLPEEDSLKDKGKRLSQQWSQDLLVLGEAAYQEGNLDRAIQATNAIPLESSLFRQAEDRAQQWRSTWEKAESIYREASETIQQKKWSESVATARVLLSLGNQFWSTVKYQELMNQLEAARGGNSKQGNSQAGKGNDKLAFQSNLSDPARWKQDQEKTVAARMQRVYALAKAGSLESLKAAVAEAEQIAYQSDRYDAIQQDITAWRRKIEALEDGPHLSQAYALASKGDEASLQAAIDQAYQIYPGRALYEEARSRIDQWSAQLEQLQSQALDRQAQTLHQNNSDLVPSRYTQPEPSQSSTPQASPASDLPRQP